MNIRKKYGIRWYTHNLHAGKLKKYSSEYTEASTNIENIKIVKK